MRRRTVLALFLGGLSAVVFGFTAWDVYLWAHQPETETISTAMSALGDMPFVMFGLGYVQGALTWGLAAHFWAGAKSDEPRKD